MRFLRNKEGTIVAVIVILIGIAVGYFAVSTLAKYYWDAAANNNAYKKVTDEFYNDDENKETPTVPADPNAPLSNDTKQQLLDKYNKMHNINKDYVFWLSMEGINLEYPVVSSSNDRMGEYTYLTHDFYKKKNKNGCLFMSENCTTDSDNIIIYGHNMKSGEMFGKLNRYEKASFVKEHPLILVYLKDEIRYYEIISVFTCPNAKRPFNWESYTYMPGAGQRVRFGYKVKNSSMIATKYDPTIHMDKFLTLVTCEYTHEDGRLVVIARQLGTPKIEDYQKQGVE